MAPKVGIVSTDWPGGVALNSGRPIPGGANYIRLQQWRPHSTLRTIDGTFVSHPTRGIGIIDGYGRVHHDLDVIIMQRLMFKDVKHILKAEQKRAHRPIIINDLDDWYWGLDPSNAAYAYCQPKNNPDENINHYREIMKISDVITVSTPFLQRKMSEWVGHDHVVRIENCVDVATFTRRSIRSTKPIVGWVGSTAHRSRDLEELNGFFDESYRIHHTGHSPSAPSFTKALGFTPNRLTTLPPLAPVDYAAKGFPFDIGICPLSDKDFNEAKSWIKAIEYAAAGVPFVASPRSEYIRLRDEYGIGRIAHTREEWLAHIHELYDSRVRAAEAQRQRKVVEVHLDVKNMAEAWDELIYGLL